MPNLWIHFSINNAEPRVVPVPTVSEARQQPYLLRDYLSRLVLDYGAHMAAVKYCEDAFAHNSGSVTHLCIHDSTGPLRRFI